MQYFNRRDHDINRRVIKWVIFFSDFKGARHVYEYTTTLFSRKQENN